MCNNIPRSVWLPYAIAQMTPLTSRTLSCLPSLTAGQSICKRSPWKPICALPPEGPYWWDGWWGECDIPVGITQTASACCGIIPLVPTRGLRQTRRYHQSHKRHWGGPGVKGRMVTEHKKKRKKRWEWVLRLVHYSSAWRHTGMTPGPRAATSPHHQVLGSGCGAATAFASVVPLHHRKTPCPRRCRDTPDQDPWWE